MLSAALTSAVLGLTVFILCIRLVKKPRNLPPGPWGLPLLGYRFGPGPAHEQYAKLAQRYGPVFSLRVGPYLSVVLNSSASIRQALLKQGDAFSERYVPGNVRGMLLVTNKYVSVLWDSGNVWSDLRRFSVSTLRTFGMGQKMRLEPQINLEARQLCEELVKSGGQATDFAHLLTKATANVILQLVIGKRYDYDDDQLHEIVDCLNAISGSIPLSDPVQVFPFLFRLPIKRYTILRQSYGRMCRYARTQLENHRETFQADNIRDLCDAYFADERVSKAYPVEGFWRVLVDLLAAGTETTSSTLSWGVIYMTIHQDVQRKVQAELDTVVGQGRQPSVNDRPNLPYCEATLMEIMRIRPVAPITVPHMTARTVSLGDYIIPRGTIVFPNLWAVLHDPSVWKDPCVFDPERFLDGGRLVMTNDAWIPFSIGSRECLGSHLAKMELFLLFTNLLQRFDFQLPPGQSHSLNGIYGTTMFPEPYHVCATER